MYTSKKFAATLSLFLFLALGCKGSGEGDEPEKKAPRAAKENPVRVWKAHKENLQLKVTAIGTVEAEEDLVVSSEVKAVVKALSVDEGDYVKKGELLLSFDDEELKLKKNKIEADLRRSTAEHSNAEKDLKRKEDLLKEGMVSAEDYDNSLTNRDSKKGARDSDEANLKIAEKNLAGTKVLAPFSGYISEKFISPGSYIREGDKLFRLIDSSSVKVSARVPQKYLRSIKVGSTIAVTAPALTGHVFKGKIFFISPSIEETTRTFLIKARFKNRKGLLRAGLFVDVAVTTGVEEGVFIVPEKGIITRDNRDVAYVVVDGVASERTVVVTAREDANIDGFLIVTKGLSSGDLVVSDGAHTLVNDSKVRVVE